MPGPIPEHQCKKSLKNSSSLAISRIDVSILLNPVGWINDSIVSAAQMLLKRQSHVSGFQNPCLGMTLSFHSHHEEFIQILHNGQDHWITVSNISCQEGEIEVFDSIYNTIGSHSRKQIASLLDCEGKKIYVKIMDVQFQKGGHDCGLFAIAFATALSNGVSPGKCTFKQQEMRKHLYECLNKGELLMFPLVKGVKDQAKVKSLLCRAGSRNI